MAKTFEHETDANRYVLTIDDELVAVADYRDQRRLDLVQPHVHQSRSCAGTGYAGEVVEFAMDDVEKTSDRHVVPMCWYVGKWFDEHPERAGLLTRRHVGLSPGTTRYSGCWNQGG